MIIIYDEIFMTKNFQYKPWLGPAVDYFTSIKTRTLNILQAGVQASAAKPDWVNKLIRMIAQPVGDDFPQGIHRQVSERDREQRPAVDVQRNQLDHSPASRLASLCFLRT